MSVREKPESVTASSFPVSVLMVFREPGDQPWDTGHWDVMGVVAGNSLAGDARDDGVPINTDSSDRQFLWPGFRLELFKDDAGSYYHNLMGSKPRIFVVCREGDSGRLEPFMATPSYDEAAAYTEVEEEVFAVPMPPEVYRWAEKFVLEHYVPEKKKKRKRENWKKPKQGTHVQRR